MAEPTDDEKLGAMFTRAVADGFKLYENERAEEKAKAAAAAGTGDKDKGNDSGSGGSGSNDGGSKSLSLADRLLGRTSAK